MDGEHVKKVKSGKEDFLTKIITKKAAGCCNLRGRTRDDNRRIRVMCRIEQAKCRNVCNLFVVSDVKL